MVVLMRWKVDEGKVGLSYIGNIRGGTDVDRENSGLRKQVENYCTIDESLLTDLARKDYAGTVGLISPRTVVLS
jgi:hypothetical protein